MTRSPDRSRESLLTALAASVLVHAALGMAFGRHDGAMPAPLALLSPPLSIRIANLPESLPAAENPASARLAAVRRTDDADAHIPSAVAATAPTVAPPSVPAPDVRDAASKRIDGSANLRQIGGTVTVAADATVGRAGRYLQERVREQFPTEVWHPVRIADPIRVAYPPAALASHREGIVIAFLVVAADGSVQELDIIEGDDDLSVAVADALATARLAPAEEIGGKPISFYTVLEFDFRIDGAQPSAGATAASAR
jgi:hypothetical protein